MASLSFLVIGSAASARLVFRPIYPQVLTSGVRPDDRLEEEVDTEVEKRLKRRMRIIAEDEMLIRIVVSCVTEGLLE